MSKAFKLLNDLYMFWDTKNWTKFSLRIACDGFLINYLKNNFSKEKPINILDVGCGKGHYSRMIRNLGYRVKYTGIDIAPRKVVGTRRYKYPISSISSWRR